MTRTQLFRSVHRYISLTFAAFWFLQALTGVLLVFHWELDDLSVGARRVPLDVAAVGTKIQQLHTAVPGERVTSVYATGGIDNRFDIRVERNGGKADYVRIDGAGAELRQKPANYDELRGGLIDIAITIHHNLFLGDIGKTFVGISGILLLSNIVLGLLLAWPRRGQWRRTLTPKNLRGGSIAFFYGWHRAIGLWLAFPALLLVATGILSAFEDPVEDLLRGARARPTAPATVASDAVAPTPPVVLQMALERWPGTVLASLGMPTEKQPWYRVRVRQDGEFRRVYGSTTLFVDARDGKVLMEQDPFLQPVNVQTFEALIPLHTGEALGLPGRILVQLLSFWLLGMIVLGVSLWWKRRSAKRTA